MPAGGLALAAGGWSAAATSWLYAASVARSRAPLGLGQGLDDVVDGVHGGEAVVEVVVTDPVPAGEGAQAVEPRPGHAGGVRPHQSLDHPVEPGDALLVGLDLRRLDLVAGGRAPVGIGDRPRSVPPVRSAGG